MPTGYFYHTACLRIAVALLLSPVCWSGCSEMGGKANTPGAHQGGDRRDADNKLQCDLKQVKSINGMDPELFVKYRALREDDVLRFVIREPVTVHDPSFLALAGVSCGKRFKTSSRDMIEFVTRGQNSDVASARLACDPWDSRRKSRIDGSVAHAHLACCSREMERRTVARELARLDPEKTVLLVRSQDWHAAKLWRKLIAFLHPFQYLQLDGRGSLRGIGRMKGLKYLELGSSYANSFKGLRMAFKELQKVDTLETLVLRGVGAHHLTAKMPQVKHLAILCSTSGTSLKWLRHFPNLKALKLLNVQMLDVSLQSDPFLIDSRLLPPSLRYLDLSGSKIQIRHWNAQEHNLRVMGLLQSNVVGNGGIEELSEGVKHVEHDPVKRLRRHLDTARGGKVCPSHVRGRCIPVGKGALGKMLGILRSGAVFTTSIPPRCVGARYFIVLKDKQGRDLPLKYWQGVGIRWKGWPIRMLLSKESTAKLDRLLKIPKGIRSCGS